MRQYHPRGTLSVEGTTTKGSDDCPGSRASQSNEPSPSLTGNANLNTPNIVAAEPSIESFTPSADPQLEEQKSEFQIRMEMRRLEKMESWRRLDELQRSAFDRQVKTMQSKQYKRLYDVFKEYANSGGETMDLHGLTSALSVFGMIIDTNSTFQHHIWSKFDLDNELEITFDDFRATMATFVSNLSDEDTLQTLFEIFDIDEDGYLRLEDFARVFLTQNQIAVVSTGGHQQAVYTKRQCIKQARKIMTQSDCNFADGRISFEQFKMMMTSRTERDMLIDHMTAPSISMDPRTMSQITASVTTIPGIKGILPLSTASSITSASSLDVPHRHHAE